MTKIAIYARYSCDKQSESSLEDQIRRCHELANRNGLIAVEELIYSDAAVSGTEKGDAHRDAYRRLRQEWDAGKFEVLIVDEFSRLSRDPVEQAVLLKRLENNRRVRLITADGIDTQDPDWQLRLGLQGLLAQHETRKLRHRVDRGMIGQLERGFMIAAPAYGYDLLREFDSKGEHLGTLWKTNEQEASIVKEVFSRREKGDSMHQIAAWLNSQGILCSRKAQTADGGHWRPARVNNMLKNPIYRGVFVWHGSTTYAAQMKAQGLPVIKQEFPRPELRLVSDETWARCNTPSISRSGYGGGKHVLSGLLSCGFCGAILALSSVKSCRSLYCATCTEAKSSKGEERLTSSVAAKGVEHLLAHALEHFISEPFLEAFRHSLRLRLTGDRRVAVEECEARLKKLKASQDRLSRMLVDLTQDDAVLQQRYEETRAKVIETSQHLSELQEGMQRVNAKAIDAQLEVDPRQLIKDLFKSSEPPQRLRAVLSRLLPSIVFEGRESRHKAIFRLRFAPGVALAIASGTESVASEEVEGKFRLQYRGSNSKEKPGYWTVDVITEPAPVVTVKEGIEV